MRDDEEAQVRARAAETLALIARSDPTAADWPRDRLTAMADETEDPVGDAATVALRAIDGSPTEGDAEDDGSDAARRVNSDVSDESRSLGIGRTSESLAERLDDGLEAIARPPSDAGCPHCDAALSDGAPPFCPACGAPIPK